MSENPVALELDDAGLAGGLPRPAHQLDGIQDVPFRPVQFRDNDLPTALERAAQWLRETQTWLGEPVDVIAIHLDYNEASEAAYYELKLLCNEEDLAGAPSRCGSGPPPTPDPPTTGRRPGPRGDDRQ
ncbi:hypothetical protein Ae717Ps2_0006c [Pseudonocardia sp. Ae717_Ps2]|uniref:hypothetical protein n=1 Tax=Pseudonocardia sp. Ae717_Ps2 TaxID=1885573 RepID=UPI0009653502|nr:hypothetical protein [Pseudonocardia sp. Ae717_Ps2]OLM29114.1 hypothetical protein Ae717Ps2_0006c [Pseudonocardia sp. Ae717_Ps2]